MPVPRNAYAEVCRHRATLLRAARKVLANHQSNGSERMIPEADYDALRRAHDRVSPVPVFNATQKAILRSFKRGVR